MGERAYRADVVVVGGGIAGISAALELLEHDKRVLLVDRDSEKRFGGQAITAFGGMLIVGTPLQKRMGVKDSPSLAFSDWCNRADFGEDDILPRKWAEMYCRRSMPDVYQWVRDQGVKFLPNLIWPERGLFGNGNSVPRYHIVLGTGHGCTSTLIRHLLSHRNRRNLQLLFDHRVRELVTRAGKLAGVSGERTDTGEAFSADGEAVILAAGGLGGDLDRVRRLWPEEMGAPPDDLFLGSHPFCDGAALDMAERKGAVLTNHGHMWNYPEGVQHPRPAFEHHGLRVIAPKSALWMDYRGRRFGPVPLVAHYDTAHVVRRICEQRKKYSWHIMNWKIAARELALSGAEHNEAIRDKKLVVLMKQTLLGNGALVRRMLDECPDFIAADSVAVLADRMNELVGSDDIDAPGMERDIRCYDEQIERGVRLHNDDQLRRIASARNWSADKLRTCKFQKIVDRRALPLIAVRYRVLTRKCLGGIRTDLESRVVDTDGETIEGLYAAGESAGFGGGGVNGKSSLEGTFIASCILSGRIAARSIAGEREP